MVPFWVSSNHGRDISRGIISRQKSSRVGSRSRSGRPPRLFEKSRSRSGRPQSKLRSGRGHRDFSREESRQVGIIRGVGGNRDYLDFSRFLDLSRLSGYRDNRYSRDFRELSPRLVEGRVGISRDKSGLVGISRDKSRYIEINRDYLDFPRFLDFSRLASARPETSRKFLPRSRPVEEVRGPRSRFKIEIGTKKKSRSRFSVEIGEASPIDLAHR